jgi:hypothetical protein
MVSYPAIYLKPMAGFWPDCSAFRLSNIQMACIPSGVAAVRGRISPPGLPTACLAYEGYPSPCQRRCWAKPRKHCSRLYYFSGNGQRGAALKQLQQTAQIEGSKAYWQAESSWGGNLEVTADVARVMYDAGDDLFRPAFTYVTSKLINGMLYSTADTRALVELLASLKFDPATKAVIDGKEVALGEVALGQEVTAMSDNLIVRLDEEIEINHLEPRADFQFSVKPSKTRLKVGERIQITVIPKEETIAPLARLFLPGNLALLKGGANAQTAYLPIEKKELTVDAVAVRPGQGKLYVSVHDMYDAEKIGTIPGMEFTVR